MKAHPVADPPPMPPRHMRSVRAVVPGDQLGATTTPGELRDLCEGGFDGPSILITGMHGEAIQVKAMAAGFVAFFPKGETQTGRLESALQNEVDGPAGQPEPKRRDLLSAAVRSCDPMVTCIIAQSTVGADSAFRVPLPRARVKVKQ